MNKLKQQFLEVSDALALGNPAIIEKDYWVVALLAQLEKLIIDSHQLVFSGGTALAKSNVKIMRMSEDVDIKLIPNADFHTLSRSKKKIVRKSLLETLEKSIRESNTFLIENKQAWDEYRYVEYDLKYPQQFSQAPCLRPIIKLELMETIPLQETEQRSIQSLVAELYQHTKEVKAFACISVHATLVEKIISMLRRTMLAKRDENRKDDQTLVRHIYDVYCIDKAQQVDIKSLSLLFNAVLQEDITRFGNQHTEFVNNPSKELQDGLSELENNLLYRQRFDAFVTPMVFNQQPHDFDSCFASFKRIAELLIKTI
ncbi:nucleotidyl transferase AbiEii/AbiGii toxin family protein [Photobacterium phosphoreum]|uniref:nucleotidyl transferase AbiEii/AbiGii toxin family protein n=1 Tax=Photobacterium phosphoreum TaxID=659 RepID=UPI001E2E2B95|nr:nucleotidyl transferase AbiEii/AbiGii toxin family protein [Photobacterium phosphoreum]MCD9517556.1 nucleotidyl transferase AbiEii/AbiGii toxin family protein [Photobacterium phosphoreum]